MSAPTTGKWARGRAWRTAAALAVAVVGLSGLMQVPVLNPGSVRGSQFGLVILLLWAVGLAVWALGRVRSTLRGGTWRTLRWPLAWLAAFLALATTLGYPAAPLFAYGALSAALVRDGLDDSGSIPLRSPNARALLVTAGLLGLAQILRAVTGRYVEAALRDSGLL